MFLFPPGKHFSCEGGPWLSECWDGCASACTCPFELAVLEDSLYHEVPGHIAFNNACHIYQGFTTETELMGHR